MGIIDTPTSWSYPATRKNKEDEEVTSEERTNVGDASGKAEASERKYVPETIVLSDDTDKEEAAVEDPAGIKLTQRREENTTRRKKTVTFAGEGMSAADIGREAVESLRRSAAQQRQQNPAQGSEA